MNPTNQKWIVFLDDEEPICNIVQIFFEKHELPIFVSHSVEKGLEFVAQNPVAVVFCDYRMPNLNGLQVLGKLPTSMPFYLLSGEIGLEDELRNHPRILGILGKPIALQEMVNIARKHIG